MGNVQKDLTSYSIGLDIGTTSVGWAVTDEQTKLLKKGNQPLWGYNLFEEASPAAARRVFRGTRRRYKRRKQRVKLLQDFCEPMIADIDPLFYKRLENSYLVGEDRKVSETGDSGNIFFVSGMTDKEYYSKYPTIYHLRKALAENDEKADPRLVYLALHHIVKYRGNFLYEGQDLSKAISEEAAAEKMKNLIEGIFEDSENGLTSIDCTKMIAILINHQIPGKQRLKNCQELVQDKSAKEAVKEISNAVLGYKFNVDKIFGSEYAQTVSFSDSDIDDKKTELESILGDSYEFLETLEGIYSFAVLKNILSNSSDMSISSNMIAIYDKHKEDLQLLKAVLKQDNTSYTEMFSDQGIYQKFIKNPSKTSQDDLYKGILKLLSTVKEDEDTQKIRKEIEVQTFLPRQNSIANGAIPYQLHLQEMKQIIEKQGKYYSCLKDNESKLLSIVSFRIPYYVGPLVGSEHNQFAWMKRSDDSKDPIRPWSWKEQIDREATAEEFIKRMQNHCTYLLAEDTLPKNSIILNRFNVMNELNKVRLNDHLFSPDTRDQIIKDLFLKKNEVKKSDLERWLIDHQFVTSAEEWKITGINDSKFNSSLKSEIKFRSIFGDEFDGRIDDAEKLISWITVYNSKEILKTRIQNAFTGDRELTEQQMNSILNLHYTGYGRFSEKLINGLVSRNQRGFVGTIMEIMKQSDIGENFMQIINNPDYGFMQQIEDENEVDNGKLSYAQVSALPGSPALKRGIWQSIRVVQDIVKYMKQEPAQIYIEFARNEGEKKQTNSRYRQLEKIYKEYLANSDTRKELEANNKNLDDDRLYLYFMQNGKCMYSGKPLDINQLSTYQVDHILPQSYIKDDSIENKALVIAEQNQRKADSLLLDDAIVRKQYSWWESLLKMNLIGSKKFHNLTRTAVTEQEQSGFIARQLVETRQICVHVKNILAGYYKTTSVRVIHAPLSSEFRRKFGLVKIRNLNSVHHAQDAYLACLMGEFVNSRFPFLGDEGKIEYRYVKEDIIDRIKQGFAQRKDGPKIKDEHIMYSFIVNQMRNDILANKETGVIYWGGKEQIEYIKKIFDYKNYFYSYQTREDDGKLYNATIYPAADFKDEESNGIATKQFKPAGKYGGYKSIEKSYGVAVRYAKGKKTKGTVVSVPVVLLQKPELLEGYLCNTLGVSKVEIIRKIELGQTFIVDNCLYTMSSPEEWRVRQQIFLSSEDRNVIYSAEHYKTKPTESELSRVYFQLLKKIYVQIPTLQSKINDALCKCINMPKQNVFESDDLMKQAIEVFEKGDIEQQIKEINLLMVATTQSGGSDLIFGGKKICASKFGRFTMKSIDLDETFWVFTSASGIYKTVIKL